MAVATNLPQPGSVADYTEIRTDLDIWAHNARIALDAAGLPAPGEIRLGDITTFPTVLTDTGVAVKFFGEHFDGPGQFRSELAAYAVLAGSGLPVPTIVATGSLAPHQTRWSWPYLIITIVPGTPYSRYRKTATPAQRLGIASGLGRFVRDLHALPLPEPDHRRFLAMLTGRRRDAIRDHRAWGHLPEKLCARLDEFLPDPAELIGPEPVFLHADLHADHVFVEDNGISGVIDFADAYAGDPDYELVTLHLGTFAADKALLRRFLAEYGRPAPDPRRMLAWTLLHECDVLADADLDLRQVNDFDELAALVWG